MDGKELRELILGGNLSGAYSTGTLDTILAEFGRLTEENKRLKASEGALQTACRALNKRFREHFGFDIPPDVTELEAKAEALDKICEPIVEAHKDWGITEHNKLIESIEIDFIDGHITPAWDIAKSTLARICDHLDSQQ